MQQAQALYREGKLTEAIDNLRSHLRDYPSDKRARSFFFELLCFEGEFDRARKQLMILAEDSKDSRLGVAFYLAALAAEEERQAYYQDGAAGESGETTAGGGAAQIAGVFNGKRFTGIRDMDRRLGGSLEFLTAGKYHRIRYRDLTRIEIGDPKNVRDLYWLPAKLEMSEAMGSTELESILIPVLYPQTNLFDDDRTRLGRSTEWAAAESGLEIPLGQRVLEISGEEVPLLEVRSLEFDPIRGPG